MNPETPPIVPVTDSPDADNGEAMSEDCVQLASESSLADHGASEPDDEHAFDESEQDEQDEAAEASVAPSSESTTSGEPKTRKRRKRRQPKQDAAEQRMLGRRAMCKRIEDIAQYMLKTVKLRVLGRFLDSTRGLDDDDLTEKIIKNARQLADRKRIIANVRRIDPDVDRRVLREIILYGVLLQEETYSLDENRLTEKVVEYEKNLVKQSKALDFFDPKKHDQTRCHHYDTYRIVLEAAWRSNNDISLDEAALLAVLRDRLNISREEHQLIGAYIKRFPKAGCAEHTAEEIHEARKELQRESLLWSYRDENNRNIDVIPVEIVSILRRDVVRLELQKTNYHRILQHDSIRLSDLRELLQRRDMDRYGNKPELIERVVNSDIQPSDVLSHLDRSKLSDMCRLIGIKSSGNKPELIERLLDFYDDLTFEERPTQDPREVWYSNYELLATRSYSDLRAKKLISKDLDIEYQFEQATNFLFERVLNVPVDYRRQITKADGRIPLDSNQCLLWDCKCAEGPINLQDFLEGQFDGYLRREREKDNQPLAFLVIAPSFTPQSIKLAHQYKARTNWDVALIQAAALRHLADQWRAIEAQKMFPIRLLNRTELIDKDKADFLLSLA